MRRRVSGCGQFASPNHQITGGQSQYGVRYSVCDEHSGKSNQKILYIAMLKSTLPLQILLEGYASQSQYSKGCARDSACHPKSWQRMHNSHKWRSHVAHDSPPIYWWDVKTSKMQKSHRDGPHYIPETSAPNSHSPAPTGQHVISLGCSEAEHKDKSDTKNSRRTERSV